MGIKKIYNEYTLMVSEDTRNEAHMSAESIQSPEFSCGKQSPESPESAESKQSPASPEGASKPASPVSAESKQSPVSHVSAESKQSHVSPESPPTPCESCKAPKASLDNLDGCFFSRLFSCQSSHTRDLAEPMDEADETNEADEAVYEITFPIQAEHLLTGIIIAMISITIMLTYSPILLASISLVVTLLSMFILYYLNPPYAISILKKIMICTQATSFIML